MRKLKKAQYVFRRNITKSIKSVYYWRDKFPYYLGFKKAEPESMPDFIIAGLPKCGTWWLVHLLNSSNNYEFIANPFYDKGEFRFFSLNFSFPISKYFEAFRNARKKSERLLFEKSPDYSYMSRTRIKLIKKLRPDIKIILIFRHPVERAYSNAKMDLIRVKGLELTEENDLFFFKNYNSQKNRYRYDLIIKKWLSVFDSSQMLILSLEDIEEFPAIVVQCLEKFLGKEIVYTIELKEARNQTKAKVIPKTHKIFLNECLKESIYYWNNNKNLFRLKPT